MVDRIARMEKGPASSVAALAALMLCAALAACGQKGPLYLSSSSPAHSLAHAPSAPDDAMPSTQPPLPPPPDSSSPGLPSGVAPPAH
jgi:predicted small lipoprotein YifL